MLSPLFNFKIQHFEKGAKAVVESKAHDLYSYKVFVGSHSIPISKGDSAWVIEGDSALIYRGGKTINSSTFCVVIRGYQCSEKMTTFEDGPNLPYINGCSSNQLFPPVRVGDPTLQLLYLPPHTAEQKHHIHPTVRVVYVHSGKGKSIQGMDGATKVDLNEGDIIVLDKMTPHHFTTGDEPLVVLPLHIYSSTAVDQLHPMLLGTFET